MSVATNLMDGQVVADSILEGATKRVASIIEQSGVTPGLATVLVGDDPASVTYTRMKRNRCKKVGIRPLKIELPGDSTTTQLVEKVQDLSSDPTVHGILLQHPVPDQIDERAGFEAINPAKDVDGVTIHSFGSLSFDHPGFGACTAVGMMRLLEYYKVPLQGAHAVVIGRSPIVGKPMAMMLLAQHATVTICHSRTKDLPQLVRQADVVVAAVGKSKFVQGDWIKQGAVVLDAGYNPGNIGDVDFDSASTRSSRITPVPGGVGPTTIACLIDQTSIAAARQLGLNGL